MRQACARFKFLCIIIVFTTSFAYGESITLKLVYSDIESFPLQMGNGADIANPPGIAVEIIERAAEELGINVEFTRLPNKRALIELQYGMADAAFCYSFKDLRLKNGKYPMQGGKLDGSRRITSISYYLYKKKGSSLDWDGTTFINLQGRLGANSGYSIVEDLRKKGINVQEVKTTEQNMAMLQLGRISGYVTQNITADYYVESGQYGEIVRAPIPLVSKDYFLMFSHQFINKHPEISEKLWTKIGEIRDVVTKEVAPKYQQGKK